MVVALEDLLTPNVSYVALFDSDFDLVNVFQHDSPFTQFNDLTQIPSGEIFVTDAFEGDIYVADIVGNNISEFLSDSLLAAPVGSYGADGIEYVDIDGNEFLIVSNCYEGTLMLVDIEAVSIQLIEGEFNDDETFFCPDGVRKLDDLNILVVTNNLGHEDTPGALWHLRSSDDWETAEIVKKYVLPLDKCDVPTAVVTYPFENRAYVSCSAFTALFAGEDVDSFDVREVSLRRGGSASSSSMLESLF